VKPRAVIYKNDLNMRRFVDLHTHSTASDGAIAPAELVMLAERKRLAAIALTDHDTVAGLAQAAKAAEAFADLRLVRGLEISAVWPAGTMHILGLGIDETCRALQELLRQLRDARNQRNPKIIDKLRRLGLDITMDDVFAAAGGDDDRVVGRLHMANVLRKKRCVKTVAEAFKKYIGVGAPAYVDKERVLPRDAIAAIHKSGGLAVLAHPSQLGCSNAAQLELAVKSLVRDGLDGVEVYHTDHSPSRVRQYLDLARRLGLGVTGGSDFHGAGKPDARLGVPRVPLAAIGKRFAAKLLA